MAAPDSDDKPPRTTMAQSRELGMELRTTRRRAGMHSAQVAEELGWSSAKLGKLEKGRREPAHPQNYGDPETFARDVELEGPAEVEFNPGIAGRLPAKSSAGGVLLRDGQGRVLFVVPRYKPVLDLPGGIADDNESPKAACQREVREELGLQLEVGRLLVVDWVPRNGVWRDSHQFIFDGGALDDDEAAALKVHDEELGGVKFLPLDVAAPQLHPSMLRRLQLAVTAADSGETIYAEFGRPV